MSLILMHLWMMKKSKKMHFNKLLTIGIRIILILQLETQNKHSKICLLKVRSQLKYLTSLCKKLTRKNRNDKSLFNKLNNWPNRTKMTIKLYSHDKTTVMIQNCSHRDKEILCFQELILPATRITISKEINSMESDETAN